MLNSLAKRLKIPSPMPTEITSSFPVGTLFDFTTSMYFRSSGGGTLFPQTVQGLEVVVEGPPERSLGTSTCINNKPNPLLLINRKGVVYSGRRRRDVENSLEGEGILTYTLRQRNRISVEISLTQRYLEYTWLGTTWQGASLPRFAGFRRVVPSNLQPAANAPPRGHVRYYNDLV